MTNYLADFIGDPVTFMKKYSCNPDDAIEDRKGTEDPTKFQTGSTIDYHYRVMPTADRIAYLDFEKIHHTDAKAFTGYIKVTGSFTPDPAKLPHTFCLGSITRSSASPSPQ